MNELTKTKTNKMKFECCNRQQNSNEFIICSQCLKKYHYACIATTTTLQYKEVTNDFKANWLCPECNRPRAGLDNSNTPVRAAATLANDKHDSSLNVTVRNKQKFTKASDTDSSLTSADVRQIIIVQELVNPGSNGLPALQGFGVDRHLLGLKLIAIENGIEVPKLYSDPGYVRSANMRISTSQVACKCDGFMCYAPLVADGYSTCYNPRDDDVNFATAAFRAHPDTAAAPYAAALARALTDMRDLLLATSKL
ncbi:unnamed protein product, partial [Brenthis ino]